MLNTAILTIRDDASSGFRYTRATRLSSGLIEFDFLPDNIGEEDKQMLIEHAIETIESKGEDPVIIWFEDMPQDVLDNEE